MQFFLRFARINSPRADIKINYPAVRLEIKCFIDQLREFFSDSRRLPLSFIFRITLARSNDLWYILKLFDPLEANSTVKGNACFLTGLK